MEMSDEERQEEAGAMPEHAMPKYPYGLCIELNDEVIEKLGLTSLPRTGEKFYIEAEAKVVSVSAREVEGSESEASIRLQIEKLGCEGEDPKYAQKMYDKTKE